MSPKPKPVISTAPLLNNYAPYDVVQMTRLMHDLKMINDTQVRSVLLK